MKLKLIPAILLLCPLASHADQIEESVYTCGNVTVKYNYHHSAKSNIVHAVLIKDGRDLMQTSNEGSFSAATGFNGDYFFNITFAKDKADGYSYTLVEKTSTKGKAVAQLTYLDFTHTENGYTFINCTVKTNLDLNA